MNHQVKLLSNGSLEARRLEAEAIIVLETLSLSYHFEVVTDFLTIINYPVKGTPALVIDERVVCSGHVPSRAQMRQMILSSIAAESAAV